MSEKTKPDPTPREVFDIAHLSSFAFVTDEHGNERLELRLLEYRPDQPLEKRIVIPWSSARHAPRIGGTSIQLIRTETESEALHRMHSELFAEMHGSVEREAP